MIDRTCEHCHKAFHAIPANVRRGLAKFCSRACYHAYTVGRPQKHPWVHPSLADALWPRVVHSEGCWIFNGPRSGGYGRFRMRGKYVWAHHASYELTSGPIPTGLWVLHHCDNPPCVRPDHLFVGTVQDNTADMVAKGRQFSEKRMRNAPRGERHYRAKLTGAQVAEIRHRVINGGERHGVVAQDYGIARRTVGEIAQGTRWRALVEPT